MKIVTFGGDGLVGSRFLTLYGSDFTVDSKTIDQLNLLDHDRVANYLNKSDAEAVVNFAAFTNVEKAEEEKGNIEGLVYKVNSLAVKNLAESCKGLGLHLIQISTEYVFNGSKDDSPYSEEDKPNPINWYGATKYFAEQFVIESGCSFTILRICMPFAAKHDLKGDIARFFLNQLKDGKEVAAIKNAKVTPILVDDIAQGLKKVAESKYQGIIHVCPKDWTTPFDFAKKIAQTFNLDESLVKEVTFEQFIKGRKAPLLKNSWLSSEKFRRQYGEETVHTIEESLKIFKTQLTS